MRNVFDAAENAFRSLPHPRSPCLCLRAPPYCGSGATLCARAAVVSPVQAMRIGDKLNDFDVP